MASTSRRPHRAPQSPRHRRSAAHPSALLLQLVARAAHRWLRWWQQRLQALKAWRAARRGLWRGGRFGHEPAWVQAPRVTIETLEPRLLLSGDLAPVPAAPSVPGGLGGAVLQAFLQTEQLVASNPPAAAVVADPLLATLQITGPGSGSLVSGGSGFALQLSGTTAATQVSVALSGGGGASRFSLASLSADAGVGTLNLGNADLAGNASINGAVGTLKLASAPSGRLGVAGALQTLAIAGDAGADVFVAGAGASAFALGTATVGGRVAGGIWSIHGRSSAISAAATAAAWRLNVSGALSQLVTQGDASGDVAVGALQLLQVGGSANGLHLRVGADLGDDAALGGSGANADRFAAGTLVRVRITGSLLNSQILAGVDPVDGIYGNGNDRMLGSATNRLTEFVVGGTVSASQVIAPAFPATVRIGGASVNPATLPAIFATSPGDVTAPSLAAALRLDTGSAGDGLTSDAAILITASDAVGVTGFDARIGSSGSFGVITPSSTATAGTYLLDAAALATLNGGSLPDGAYTVQIRARDAAGNLAGPVSVSFTLDRTAPTATLALAAASDTGVAGDLVTTLATVTIIGQATPGVRVRLGDEETTADGSGAFGFAGVALALGANPFSVSLTDAAGNTGSASIVITREAPVVVDTTAPALGALSLAVDSGRSASDRLTNTATISGTASDDTGVAQLFVTLDDGSATDLASALAGDGRFTLSRAQLDALAGGSLGQGGHTVTVVARDAAGNASTAASLAFTLDSVAPAGAGFGLASADALNGNDAQTSAAVVTLRGSAEAGATVSAGGVSALVGGGGSFTLPGVALALGDNALTLTVTDAAGNSQSVARVISRVAAASSDAVLQWNTIALRAVQLDVTDPPVATRNLALVSLAQYDTLAAIEGTPAYLVQLSASGASSAQAALATAAHRVLSTIYPAQKAVFDAALASQLAAIADGAAKDRGIALGLAVADAVIAARADDGSDAFIDYPGSTTVGQWRPTGPMFDVPDEPQWKNVKPFALSSPSQFRSGPPPALDTAAYAAAVNEIKSLGSGTTSTRTAEQTQIALFWADGKGSFTPPGHWNQIAAQVAASTGNSLSANARLFAQLNVALADAAIACWDVKYTYGLWRPETAIQDAELDGNDATTEDDTWRPLLITPPHPEYVSGHSTFSAAAAAVLANAFGDATAFSTTSATLPGVTRSFTSFSQAAQEAGRSRIYGGIHFEFTNQAGQVLGAQVAGEVLRKFALTEDTQAPTIAINASPATSRTNLVFSGQVLDNLSGVASAQYRLDNGALQPLALGANGSFTITTAFATDGSADGAHTLTLVATDAAGNLNAGVSRSFTLDTTAPGLTLTSLAEGDALTANSRLTGAATDSGSAITLLNYRIDGGAVRSLAFDPATGGFDAALVISNLEVGNHVLLLTTRDAAGNTRTLTRNVRIDALAPFTVTGLDPSDGSGNVGVTQRPRVSFSRAVNPATLTADSFYATAPDGSKLAATIVPAADGSFAWLFFSAPMPGGSLVTLHVDGSKIRAAADGSFLDADGNGSAGGELTASFTTVSTTVVAGTRLVGKVVDPGPDLEPMTFDDIRRGPDGVIHTPDDVFLNPIAHAKVYILGQEDKFVYTDAQGNFELTGVPAGAVKVAIDGRTATNAPAGVFFPEMVMAADLVAGATNTLMGTMGSTAERQANLDRREVYLPRVASTVLQPVSSSEPTVITVDDPKAAPALSETQRQSLTLTVNPGSAVGEDGRPVANAQIGIATVPPELVRDMLPPGVLQHTFDITIQAPGVATFTEPVQITFPNVFNAAPGTQLNILSFDHTTGMLVINGTGTVSADGLTVVSDPDSGVKAPGWHGLTPPGGPSDPPCPPAVHDIDVPPVPLILGVQDRLFTDDSGAFTLSFANGAPKLDPSSDACSTTNIRATPLVVQVTVEGPNVNEFLTGLASATYTLLPSQQVNIQVAVNDLLAQIKTINKDRLYGAKITVQAWKSSDPGTLLYDKKAYVYRFLDAADSNHADGLVEMADTDVDGAGGVMRFRDIDHLSGAALPTLEANDTTHFWTGGAKNRFIFDPTARGQDLSTGIRVVTPDGNTAGTLNIKGDAERQRYFVDSAGFKAELAAVAAGSVASAAEKALIDTDAKRTALVTASIARANTLLAPFSLGLEELSATNADAINFNDFTTPAAEAWNSSQTSTTLGLAGTLDNTANGGAEALVAARANYSVAEQNFRLSETLNESQAGQVAMYISNYFGVEEFGSDTEFINTVGKTLAHELGHNIGLFHTSDGTAPDTLAIAGSGTDVMAQGIDKAGARTFSVTADAFRVAVGLDWTEAQAQTALDYYQAYVGRPNAASWGDEADAADATAGGQDGNRSPNRPLDNPVLWVVDAQKQGLVTDIDFGSVLADGAGGTVATRELTLYNAGARPVVLGSIGSSDARFKISGPAAGTVLAAGQRLALTLSFDPALPGSADGKVTIASNSLTGNFQIQVAGRGQSAGAQLEASMANNNVGGQKIGAGAKLLADAITLRNDGQQPLAITSIDISSSDFRITGLAQMPSAASPLVIAAGASLKLGLAFDPGKTGLSPAKIRFTSNAAGQTVTTLSVVGTGLADRGTGISYGNDFVSLDQYLRPGAAALRTVSDAAGNWSFFLPPNEAVHSSIFDPTSGLIAHGWDTTPASGRNQHFTEPTFAASTAPDSDGDGLPDDIENTVGTNVNGRDTDKDGLDDFTEIQQGLDPLGGLNIPVGVAGAAALQGTAEAVAVVGSLDGSSSVTALVATGAYGLAVVDASNFSKPKVLAELDLAGNAVDVAVDATRQLAVVAAGDGGLELVDIANPSAPVLRSTVAFGSAVSRVEVRDGLAYAISGGDLVTVDLNTGEPLSTLTVAGAGNTLQELALDGSTLYTVDSARTLRAISISGNAVSLRGALALPAGGGRLFVGGGVAYLGAGNGGVGGFVTANVADPDALALLSGVDNNSVAGTALAANGSGLAVGVGSSSFVFGAFRSLDVFDVSDPTNTASFLTRIDLPQVPRDVALADGLAFVADGSGGLQIVNYIGLDTAGVPPTVSISVDGVDADPATPGVQVLEGRAVRVLPVVRDDVQVRNVELLVNGSVVANDVAFPFEMSALAPAIAGAGTTMTIQVRATDTGGNASLSDPVTLTVVPDTFPPQLVSSSLAEGARLFFVRSIDLAFDEPLDTARLSAAGVTLLRAGADGAFGTADDVAVPVRLDTRAFGQSLSVLIDSVLPAGDYRLSLDPSMLADRAGNVLATPLVRNFSIRPASDVRAASGIAAIPTAPSANPLQQIGIAVPFNPAEARLQVAVIDAGGNVTQRTLTPVRTDAATGRAFFTVPVDATSGDAVVYQLVGATRTDFADGSFPLQILPTITDVQVESIAADGSSAQVLIAGTGFVEGGGSAYLFGSTEIDDSSTTTGADVFGRSDATLGFVPNGYVRVTVPLSAGVFGAINIKTAGGTSASYTASIASITATALSGTPTDADQASANAGQAITLNGSGLTLTSDILLRWIDIGGAPQMVRLSPSAVSADGSSATLIVPPYANGAFALQMFGSASQPLLQIVPTLSSYDVQDRTALFGSGFVEGGTTYSFPGVPTLSDSPADASTIDVYYTTDFASQNGSAYLNRSALPTHGLGSVTISTLGGTSAPLVLNSVRTSVAGTSLGDVAVDAAGLLWVGDQSNPGHLLKIDPASGKEVAAQTITLTNDFGLPYAFNYLGLQVLGTSMTLNGVAVPAGSLLVFDGYPNTDRVTAVNPLTGAVIKSGATPASLALDTNYDLTGATYDPVTKSFFLTANNIPAGGTSIVTVDALTGTQRGVTIAPFNIQSWSGLAIDPTTGHLWLGAINGGSTLVEYQIGAGGTLTQLRLLDISSQGINQNEISGLSFSSDGTLYVASTQGEIYQVDLGVDPAAVPTATLTGLTGLALQGTPASAAAASANVGQVIELTGTNFGAGTRVLFNIRDNAGATRVVSQTPLAINADGTRLQVQVPDLATSGDVRVVNQGSRNLGFVSYADAVYRNVTLSFVAGAATAAVRFADGGLEGLANESWGIDNVLVKLGDATVFADDFESGANAAWSDATVDASDSGTFTRFSGRFSNGVGQTLNLSGLTAGQTYSLSFDLLVLDSWDGNNPNGAGPDLIDVSVDGKSVMRETLANFTDFNSAQTLRASAGIRLQIVPTLTGISGNRPGEDAQFNLLGSGFMEGACSVTIGGVVLTDSATNLTPFDVSGANNGSMTVVAPRTLDGPIRITTEGGFAQIAASFPPQPASVFTGITASAASGVPGNPAAPSANTGQTITLTGQGFTSSTLVQFQGIDDSGALGTLTRTGSVGSGGTTLTLTVPALARSGAVTVLGSGASFELQVVPTLKSAGGSVSAGSTLVLEGSGLTANDLAITIDGRGVGGFSVRTVVDGTNGVDQQLITLTVPAGVGAGLVSVSTGGGSALLRAGAPSLTALADLSPPDVGDTLAAALNTGLAANQSLKIASGIAGVLDVDLQRVDLAAGEQLTLNVSAAVGYTMVRIFDATGTQVSGPTQFNPGSANTALRFVAPAAGTYYVGVSGYANTTYNPTLPNSGNNASYLGAYTLSLERLAAGQAHLGSIAASAASGTPAQSGIASANTGQTITLGGVGLLASDRVVFTTLDDNGNLSEVTVAPASVDLAGQTLTVVVPVNATTGRVRLERDASGVLLQIVPTLSDVTMSAGGGFVGANLQLAGSGFAEGAMSVQLGGQTITDVSRFAGLDGFSNATRMNLTVPAGAATGPVRVTTVGGTSTTFGIGLTSITASGASGTPADSGVATANAGQTITLNGIGLDNTTDVVFQVIDASGTVGDRIVRATAVNPAGTQLQVIVPIDTVSGVVRVVGSADAIALQIVPTITDVQVESVASDGSSAQLLIAGTGFVEGGGSELRFGSRVVLDAGTTTGADVFGRSDATLGFVPNGYVRVTVPLSAGVFGAINIKTAGGTSASYTASIASITATALSGTPTDADQASANAGQAITLNGSGLTLTSDILLRWIDIGGAPQMVRLSPSAVSADGSSATLIVPPYANGAFALQMFGSASQPLLQIVPTLSSYDVQDRTALFGSGFVEGGTTYSFPGVPTLSDSPADASTIDVYYTTDFASQNGSAYLNRSALPTHGLGSVTISTLGGTSAPLVLNSVRTSVAGTSLGDVAVDAAGLLWVGDQSNPGHLLRIDPASGKEVAAQTITLTNDFGLPYAFNYLGLQVLGTSMTLNGVAVPAGSLLVFDGYPNTDRVTAVNPLTGAVIKSGATPASLALDTNYDLTGATYDPVTKSFFLTANNIPAGGTSIVTVDALTGTQRSVTIAPFNIQTWSGLAIDPTTGHLWLGAINGGSTLVEYQIGAGGTLTQLRLLDISSQGINQNEISGLSFSSDGTLYVASTQGEIYQVDLGVDPAAVPTATLTGLTGLALQGTPASAAAASANVGQVIELTGTNFGAGTRVLFNIRDNAGATRVVSQTPLAINADGTRLQVQVPDLATSGDVRVVNQGSRNLGFVSYADAVYRNVTLSFVAGAATAAVRFADGGLEGLANESWGIDNVLVKLGDATVFADDFESGANAAWSDATVDASDSGTFTRFSGRFSNGVGQTLNLSGLTAGQTYSLSFDLLVLDSWDGNNPNGAGPDLIDVSVDGKSVMRETLANFTDFNSAQTLRASAGIRLQIVPTLTGISGNRPGEDAQFNLLGSGFMEGACSVTIGGVVLTDSATNLTPFDVSGANNGSMTVVAPRTLDGPIRITTEGGFAQIAASFPPQPASVFTGITASAASGVPGNPAAPSANTGQTITLTGQGFTSSTLVQFQGIDDSGALGTLTRTGSVGSGGTTLTLTVPALARSGAVTVLGSGASFELQVVPTLKSAGGSVSAGSTLVLEGSGLTANDLAITIDGRGVGGFSVRTVVDGTNGVDQQLITLTVPAGVGAGLVSVSTGGGSALLRAGAPSLTALADLSPPDVGDTLAAALNTGLAANQSLKIASGIAGVLDVDLQRVDLAAGEQLTLNVSAAVGYTMVRIFDATGTQVSGPTQFNPGSANTALRFVAPAAGTYYVGVSGYANTTYNPTLPNSGNNASYLGAYTLSLERLAAGQAHLGSIAASAASGTPAQSGIASANTGQTITLGGVGLLASDRVVFTTLDDNGNLSEVTVAPASVDLAGQTLTVVVPVNATTGRVRLERDASGVLLQIVPTLSDVTMSAGGGFVGANLQLAGSGFAEGAMSVQLGGQTITDVSRFAGLDGFSNATRMNLTVPAGAATGPVRVTTVGGTSTTFGIGLTSITASGASGTPADSGVATANAGQTITLNGIGLDNTTDVVFQVIDASGTVGDRIVRATAVNPAGTQLQVIVPIDTVSGVVRVVGSADAIALQIVPTITDVQVESVAADGSSAQLLIAGTGFVEGGGSELRFGSRVVLDAGTTTGADVFGRSDATLGFVPNGYVRVTVPLSAGVFGAINIKTAGGTSASYTASIASITATALSGTPTDADQASANAGQAITLNGSGLTLTSDILLRWIDIGGAPQMVRLSPSAVSADGSSATLIVPPYANGAFALQMFGSASQPLLQIVPTLSSYDVQDRTVLFGSGFVEGGTTYSFPGVPTLSDTPADASTIDVYYTTDFASQNGSAYLNRSALPTHGLGSVTISTLGGTSAPLVLNSVRTSVAGTSLGDVAVDAAGLLWVGDQSNPGHLLRIDPASGKEVAAQTITLTNDFGLPYAFNYLGLQVLGTSMTLNGVAVPAGSLLVFDGYPNTDRVTAVNPLTGAVIKSGATPASLALDTNYDLTGATYDPVTKSFFLTANNIPAGGTSIVTVDALTGTQRGVTIAPFNIQSWSGLAIDPTTGHLWLGAINGGSTLVEYQIGAGGTLTQLRLLDISSQGINQNEISGLSFSSDGTLYVASTQGEIYVVTV